MKIGFVIDDTLDKTDGVQQYVLTLGAWLTKKGNSVHYLVGESYRTDIPNVHSLSRNVKVNFNQNQLSVPLPASKNAIASLLKREKFDVLHVQMPYSPFLAARVVRAAHPRTVIIGTFHILPFSSVEKIGTRILGLWLHRNLRRFDATIAVSDAAADFAHQSFGITPIIIPNVINLADFRVKPQPTKQPPRLTIATIGRLVPRKGVLQLLQAIALLPLDVRERLQVHIAGKGPLLATLQRYVADKELQDVVEFKGFISEADKPAFLNQADIAIFPSLAGESFGIVLIEAMAAGAGIVVGGNNPGYRSVLKPWPEALFTADNPQEIAVRLKELIDNPELRKRIHAQQQQAVLQYDVAKIGTELIALYSRRSSQG